MLIAWTIPKVTRVMEKTAGDCRPVIPLQVILPILPATTLGLSPLQHLCPLSLTRRRNLWQLCGDSGTKENEFGGSMDFMMLSPRRPNGQFPIIWPLAIDQLTIAPMIENHRTGLLWRLFMSCPEVQQGLQKLGFTVER